MSGIVRKRNNLIDIFKFLYAIVIMAGHSVTVGVDGKFPFQPVGILTEFFMIVTGYYTCVHYDRLKELKNEMTDFSCLEKIRFDPFYYTLKKFIPLMPFVVISIVIRYIPLMAAAIEGGGMQCFIYLKYLVLELVLSNYMFEEAHQHVGTLWYLAALVVIFPLYCMLFQVKNISIRNSIAYCIVVIYYYNLQISVTADYPRVLIRVLCGLCAGLLVYTIVSIMKVRRMSYRKNRFLVLGGLLLLIPLIMSFLSLQNRRIPLLSEFIGLVSLFASEECVDCSEFTNRISSYLGKMSMAIFILHWSVGEMIRWIMPSQSIELRVLVYFLATFAISVAMLYIMDFLKE